MSKTRAETRFKALAIAVGGDIGQTPSAEDAATLDGYIDVVIDRLSLLEIVSIPDAEDIDDGIFLTFCQLVANAAADEFSGMFDPTKQRALENEMRVLMRQTPGYGPQNVEYF